MALNENAKKWVAALRSGDYKQARRVLHDTEADAYCCLGVACKLFVEENPGVLTVTLDEPNHRTVYVEKEVEFIEWGAEEFFGALPPAVRKWLGFDEYNDLGKYQLGSYMWRSLADLNDSDGKSFDEIADAIEAEPEGLFVNAEPAN